MKIETMTPNTLVAEHQALHEELMNATRSGGKTAEHAEEVARLLHKHIGKESEYAMPLLGALPVVAGGQVLAEMEDMVSLAKTLKAKLPLMLDEHDAIVGALEHLIGAAHAENKPDVVRFAERLKIHAQTEEEILYPAALLVGEFIKLKLGG